MTNYNLNNINDKEFEFLVRDLLQKELGLKLESFKKGKDTGIDLRYSKPFEDNSIVIQAKHWFQSTFDRLFKELIDNELPKVRQLNPKKYMIMTSIGLLPQQKEKIKEAFHPYIETTGDIWGNEDINNRLNIYQDIAISHYKLWLTSSEVLLNILNNRIKGRSNFVVEEIEKNVQLFVPTKSYSEALSILEKEKFLILSGEPGIGKTTLANHIFFGFLARDYELVYTTDIRDAESVFDQNAKQIFYSDDFLGANYLELLNPLNIDSIILNFINRIVKSENKLMVLTTRTTILNRAMQISGKFQLDNLDLKKYEIKIQDYSKLDKAKILYNHLSFSGINDEFKEKIIEDKNYMKIVSHRNYNPRLIEYITMPGNLKELEPDMYIEFIESKLINPQLIWREPYENQLDDYCRFMLTTLFSVGSTNEKNFKVAYFSRLQYEINNNGFSRINNPYNSKLKELLGSFMIRNFDGDTYSCNFFNPSIVDFLINYLNDSKDEIWRIIESAIFIEQLLYRFSLSDRSLVFIEEAEYERLLTAVKKIECNLTSINNRNKVLLLTKVYLQLPLKLVEDELVRLYTKLVIEEIGQRDFSNCVYFLKNVLSSAPLKMSILKDWDPIIFRLLDLASTEDELLEITSLFKAYDIDIVGFSEIDDNLDKIQDKIDSYWYYRVDDIVEELMDENVNSLRDLEYEVERRIEYTDEINAEFNIDYSPTLDELRFWDYTSWYREMTIRRDREQDEDEYSERLFITDPFTNNYANSVDTDNQRETNSVSFERSSNEDEKIHELFSK